MVVNDHLIRYPAFQNSFLLHNTGYFLFKHRFVQGKKENRKGEFIVIITEVLLLCPSINFFLSQPSFPLSMGNSSSICAVKCIRRKKIQYLYGWGNHGSKARTRVVMPFLKKLLNELDSPRANLLSKICTFNMQFATSRSVSLVKVFNSWSRKV